MHPHDPKAATTRLDIRVVALPKLTLKVSCAQNVF